MEETKATVVPSYAQSVPTPEPVPQIVANTTDAPQKIVPRLVKSELRLGQDLQAIKKVVSQDKDAIQAKPKDEPTTKTPVKNDAIYIDSSEFHRYIQSLIEVLEQSNNILLATVLQDGRHEIDHNEWVCCVDNDIQKDLILSSQEILPYLREKTGEPNLFMTLSVLPANDPNRQDLPYTQEEKLRAISLDHPAVAKLQKLFNTRIIFD